MMKRRDFWPVVLMISSIALLLLLQTLWLVNSYDQARNDLHRRTSDLFRGTLIEMRDSIFVTTFERYSSDSLPVPHGERRGKYFSIMVDTVKKGERVRRRRAEIVINRGEDAQKNKIIVRYSMDTLRRDSIALHYRRSLTEADIDLPFKIAIDNRPRFAPDDPIGPPQLLPVFEGEIKTDSRSLATDWTRFSPDIKYAAFFDDVRSYVYLKIGAQILFSVVLTIITSAAFWMMYRSMRSQRRLMELKNDFISNITHELKTPVTTVSVALEALRNFKGLENPKTTKEYLDIAQAELTRLSLLTDKVLKTAVFDNRGVDFEDEPVDLHKTVDQILHSMKLIFEKQKAHVTFDKKGDSFTIRGGSVHLTNVIYNLLDNALKYSFGEPQISIKLEEDDNRVILKVADKGIGIPTEYRKKIFEKFFRVPTGDVHNIKGYGLGLSYVDSVVRSHKGLIEVSSRPGEGSVFTISLPKIHFTQRSQR